MQLNLKAFWLALAGVFKFGVTVLVSCRLSSKFSCGFSVTASFEVDSFSAWIANSAKEANILVNESFDQCLLIQYFSVETFKIAAANLTLNFCFLKALFSWADRLIEELILIRFFNKSTNGRCIKIATRVAKFSLMISPIKKR